MSGHLCQYFNCRINTRIEQVKMFRFPYKNEDLCKKWIINSGEYKITPTHYWEPIIKPTQPKQIKKCTYLSCVGS